MYSTHNEGISVVAERFLTTLRNKIDHSMTYISKNMYIDQSTYKSIMRNIVLYVNIWFILRSMVYMATVDLYFAAWIDMSTYESYCAIRFRIPTFHCVLSSSYQHTARFKRNTRGIFVGILFHMLTHDLYCIIWFHISTHGLVI